jgi:hypothetical protein
VEYVAQMGREDILLARYQGKIPRHVSEENIKIL